MIIENCPTLFITWGEGEVLLENNLNAAPDLFYAGSIPCDLLKGETPILTCPQ
jgi:hypothetical protein